MPLEIKNIKSKNSKMAELNRQTAEIEESGGGHSINRVQQTPKRNATNNLI